MEIGIIINTAAGLLTAAMPYLVPVGAIAGGRIVNGALGKIGEESLGTAKNVWRKLMSKQADASELESTALAAVSSPDTLTARRRLKTVLTKIIADNPELINEISALLEQVDINDLFTYFQKRPEDLRRSFDSFIADKARGFVGRGFVLKELDKFIEANPESGGYFIIQGDPGIGKSAIMAHVVKTRGYVHHFNIASQSINKPSQFLDSVCKQLIDDYCLNIEWSDNADKDGAFLNRVLAEASKKVEAGEELVIAIDALDEVDMVGVPTRANILFLPESLPRGVFVVATTRREQALGIKAMNLRVFPLLPESADNLRDVRQYIEAHLQDTELQARLTEWAATEAEFIDTMVAKSEGNFMYLRHVLPAIKSGYFKSAGLTQLPDGLLAYYEEHWNHMQEVTADFEQVYKPVVCVLAAVKEPVSIAKVASFTELNDARVAQVIKEWIEFLHEEVAANNEHRFSVYHSTFRSFLSDEVDPGLKTYNSMIAGYYERLMNIGYG